MVYAPDELHRLGDAMMRVRDSAIDERSSIQVLSHLSESIKLKIQRLEFCIRILEDERKKVGLSPLID